MGLMDKFNLDNAIPQSKLVTIKKVNNVSVVDVPLIMDDDFSIKLDSKYGQLWEASPNDFLNLLSATINSPSGQFALQGAQIWKSTDPIGIDVKVTLEMDTDPYKDVIYPTIVLCQTCLPTINDSSHDNFITEHIPIKLKTLIPPGPNLNTLINLMKKNQSDNFSIGGNLLAGNDGKNGVYNVTIGFATFYNVIITKVEPTFSKTMAVSLLKANKLYPCRADLSISMTTMEVATTDMMTRIQDGL